MKKLYRSVNNKVIAGVAAGIATYLNVDPVIVRLLLVFLFIVTGFVPVAVFYLVAMILVPTEPAHDIQS